MVSDSQPINPQAQPSNTSDTALLERARLALQALQFEEEAARYRVACAELMEAIAEAEEGNSAPLKSWLLARRDSGHLKPQPFAAKPHDPMTAQGDLRSHASAPPIGDSPERQQTPTAHSRVAPFREDHPLEQEVQQDQKAPWDQQAPWGKMEIAAEARGKAWFESDQSIVLHRTPSSLEVAIENHQSSDPAQRKKQVRIFPPHVVISVIVHGLILVALGWWVVIIAQPEKQVSISAGEAEYQDLALETTLEQEPSEMAPSEDPESAPTTDMESLPIEVPKVASIESGVGPPSTKSELSAMAGSWSGTGGLGTNLASGAEFFGAKAAGNTFVFVVDCSPSMARDKAFESAKAEILRSLSSLKPKQRFFVLFFGAEIAPLQFIGQDPEPYMLRANPENLEKTMQWIQRVNIQKEGRHPIDAVRQAIEMEPDAIFLLFDGDTKVSNWTGRIREMNRTDDFFSQGETKIPIHVVHFFREEFVADMKRLADENEGSYRFVPRPKKGANR